MNWEQTYRQAETVWGEKPDLALIEVAPLVPKGRVLDLGMGEGRNAIYFALQGYDVLGIDLSPTAVEKCLRRAQEQQIAIRAEAADIRSAVIEPNSLSLVISTMTLQFLTRSEGETVLSNIKQGLQRGGIVYITVFSTDDPWLSDMKQRLTEVEPNTFYLQQRETHVHFFEKDELLAAFQGLKLRQLSQTILLDEGHPGVPHPHYHGILTYIGQKE